MKRALLVLPLVLAVSCSHSDDKADGPSPTPSATASATPTPSAAPTATATAAPPAAAVGPAGTKVPSGFAPSSATFVSDTVGWVLGDSPCPTGKGRCDVIARTRDGGRTWRAIPSPRTSPDTLSQIRFADPANGFVTGDRLWVTHDGGATWVPQATVVNGRLEAAAGRVWVATERGLESAPVATAAFAPEREGTHVNAFSVHGDRAIYAAADTDVVNVIRHGGTAVAHPTPCTGGQVVPAMASERRWLVVCEGDAGLGHQEKHAYETLDAGRTWRSAGDPPANTGTDVYLTTDGDFVVDNQLVAVRRGGSWTTALDTTGGVVEGGFESARLGFCIGGFGDSQTPTMRITRDAGRTWQDVRF